MIKLELAETFHFPSVNIPKKAKAFINKGLVLCCVLSCVISKRTRCSSVMCSCLRLLKVKTRDSMTFHRRRLTPPTSCQPARPPLHVPVVYCALPWRRHSFKAHCLGGLHARLYFVQRQGGRRSTRCTH